GLQDIGDGARRLGTYSTCRPRIGVWFGLMARLGLARSVGAQNWQPWFRLVCAWLLINISVNATFPAKGAFLHWCLPSLEATIIVACFAGCVSMGWRVRGWQYVSIASILLMLRALRLV